MKQYVLSAIAGALVALLTACGGGGGGGSTPPPVSSLPTAPPNGGQPAAGTIYLGVIANTSPTSAPTLPTLATVESQIGRTVAMTTHYYAFFQDFPGADEADDIAHGRIPIESWNCQPPNAAIASGLQDAYITKRADAIRAFGATVFIRYMWEMNLNDNVLPSRVPCYDPATDAPNGQFSPSQYIAAWSHIRRIFAAEGANNVVWLWNPSGSNNPAAYYPGGAQVDWIGFDKYDGVGATFDQTFAQIYGWLSPYGKPIMIGETGAAASYQPAFFESAPATLQTQFPLIRALCYFDGLGTQTSWVLNGPGLDAFKAMATSPYFSGKLQ